MTDLDLTQVLSVGLIVMAPVTLGAAWFLWILHAEDRAVDDREPKPWLRLALMLAIKATMAAVGASYLAVVTVLSLYSGGSGWPVSDLTLAMILMIEFAPVISAVYLRWLRRNRRRRGAVRPPPWSKDD